MNAKQRLSLAAHSETKTRIKAICENHSLKLSSQKDSKGLILGYCAKDESGFAVYADTLAQLEMRLWSAGIRWADKDTEALRQALSE